LYEHDIFRVARTVVVECKEFVGDIGFVEDIVEGQRIQVGDKHWVVEPDKWLFGIRQHR
jgi:hypothetical protein